MKPPPRLNDVNRRVESSIAALRRLPYREYLRSWHWHRVRALALERAGGECALCSETRGLEVHHKRYERKGFEQHEDVVVLCRACHQRHHDTLRLATNRRYSPARAPLVPASSIRWMIGT